MNLPSLAAVLFPLLNCVVSLGLLFILIKIKENSRANWDLHFQLQTRVRALETQVELLEKRLREK